MKESSLKNKIRTLQKQLKEGQSNISMITKQIKNLSPKQKQLFYKIFKDFPSIDLEDSNRALNMCNKAVEDIPLDNKRKKELLGSNLSEFIALYPDAEKFMSDYDSEIKAFIIQKQEQEKKEHQNILIELEKEKLNKLVKIPKEAQKQLKSFSEKSLAEDFYQDDSHHLFNCGQGFYEEEVYEYCFIQDVFFEVCIRAEIISSKQDVGDRLYWVDSIDSIEIKEKDYTQFIQDLEDQKKEMIEKKELELEILKNS